MRKHIPVALFSLASMVLSSCSGLIFNENKHANTQVEAIVSALENQDGETLKALFSNKALSEVDWEKQLGALLNFYNGDILSWGMDQNTSSSTSVENGKKTVMLRYHFNIVTDTERYLFFLIDYPIDDQNTDNKGLYTLEIRKVSYTGELGYWTDRMKAGISILE